MNQEQIPVNGEPIYFPKIRIRRSDDAGKRSWGFTRVNLGLFLLLLVLASLIGSFYLSQASQAATAGLEVTRLTREREHWRQANAHLRTQLAEMETLRIVRDRARELGFRERESVEYLIIDQIPLALSDQEVSPSAPVEDRDSDEPRSISTELAYWWEELLTQFDSWTNSQP